MPDASESQPDELSQWCSAALESWAGLVEVSRQDDVLERHLSASRDRVEKLRGQVRDLRARAQEAESRLREIEASTSWRLTAPLRSATTTARRLRRRPAR